MEIIVPNLKLNDSLEFLNELHQITLSDESEVCFNFSHSNKFDPLPMLIVGSSIRQFRNIYPDIRFRITEPVTLGCGYGKNMGFFKYISPKLQIGKMPGEAQGSENYIPITCIDINELQHSESAYDNKTYISAEDAIEAESGKLAEIIDRGNLELHILLTYLIREMIRNTPEHANTEKVWICGQYWPSYKLAEIAISDEGIGIYQSMTQNAIHKNYILDNESALKWSLKAGISESFSPLSKYHNDDDHWSNSGFGLYMASEICKKMNGSFCLISYGNYVLIDNTNSKYDKTYYNGTAVRIRISTDKILNAHEVINQIALQGEREAHKIKNAFKHASKPSKGLML